MQSVTIDETKNTVLLRARHRDEEGRKSVEKIEIKTRNPDTIKQVEKKLMEKGVQRMEERHPSDGNSLKRPPPKSGRGGKFTWEGPDSMEDYEMEMEPAAIDEGDPNYDEEQTVKKADDVAVEVLEEEVGMEKEAPSGVGMTLITP